MGRTRERVADSGNDECEDVGECAVDAACRIEIIHAHVIRQEIRVPCGKARCEKLVDRACRNDEYDEAYQHGVGVFDERRKKRDTDDIDEIGEQLAGNEDPFSPFEPLKDERREDVEQTGDVGNKGQDTDTGFIEPVLQEKARIKKTARKLTDKARHHTGDQHTEPASAEIVFYVIDVTQRTCSPILFEFAERKTLHTMLHFLRMRTACFFAKASF